MSVTYNSNDTSEADVKSCTSKYRSIIEDTLKSYIREIRNPKDDNSFFGDGGQFRVKGSVRAAMEPYYHLRAAPHKSLWVELLDSFNYWMKLPLETMRYLHEMSELIYNQLLLLDDFIDESDYRYGQPTAHRIFGYQQTLVTSNLVGMLIFKKLSELDQSSKAVQILCDHLIVAFNAVTFETDHAARSLCPTLDEALKHAIRKTGSFYLIISDLMQSFSDCDKDFTRLNALLALNIQNMNDYMNLSRSKESCLKDKVFAEDISRGYYSLPVVFAAQNDSFEKSKMLNIIRQKTRAVDLNNFCVDLIEQLGGIEESKILEKEIEKLILEEIDRLGGNPKLIETIYKLRQYKGDMVNPKSPKYENF